MDQQCKRQAEAIAEIFIILAEFFKYPSMDFYQDISSGKLDRELTNLLATANYNMNDTNFANKLGPYTEMRGDFNRCFLGIVRPFAPPVESVYKIWTSDPTARTPIKNSKGYLMGDSALHILHLFQHFQLEIPEEFKIMPDHLTILLELYGFLTINRSVNECYTYLNDHLDWLEDFKETLVDIQEDGFYIYVVDILGTIIEQERRRLAN